MVSFVWVWTGSLLRFVDTANEVVGPVGGEVGVFEDVQTGGGLVVEGGPSVVGGDGGRPWLPFAEREESEGYGACDGKVRFVFAEELQIDKVMGAVVACAVGVVAAGVDLLYDLMFDGDGSDSVRSR